MPYIYSDNPLCAYFSARSSNLNSFLFWMFILQLFQIHILAVTYFEFKWLDSETEKYKYIL